MTPHATDRCIELIPPIELDVSSLPAAASISVVLVDGVDVRGDRWDTLLVRAHSGNVSSGGELSLSLFSVDRRAGIDFVDEIVLVRAPIETFPSLVRRALPLGIGPSVRLVFDGTQGSGATHAKVSATLVRR